MSDSIEARLRRVYAALGQTAEHDLSAYKLESRENETTITAGIYFNKGAILEDLANSAHLAIHNIAHLTDHLKKQLRKAGRTPSVVDDVINTSLALQLVIDLSNNDKHGYPPRDGGRSRVSPRLSNLRKTLKLKPAPGKRIMVSFSAIGRPPAVTGEGSAPVVITGDIVNKEGTPIAELHETLEAAVSAWERALDEHRFLE